ncbi:G:T/U mismatch-specific DNA glycosylase [Methanolobus tindarius DSM 2278]|jgi:TDG/mug DNA glycosylase family protein|uniref:G:T/U mismatch-specific DNA glycosylase n=1 Tax=Methanolobus tindarius DSM 2278 TaxID=1090322 RepID=W9DUC0_METTI|nr:DNA-deoxyinosine glycosylase [Methanolobus tindarius]ETA69403.1 G:T/U mismatch-specific DNA glycosylase [Methanolobus tindarius DSM 2278]
MSQRNKGLEPIINDNTEILILGTFPGEKSRDKNQYYYDSRNQFWNIMCDVLNTSFLNLEYSNRIHILQECKIGLWDIIESCEIEGSLDKNIKNPEYNDFSHLTQIKKIICNGKATENKYKEHCKILYNVEVLRVPSSSSANNGSIGRSEQWKNSINSQV